MRLLYQLGLCALGTLLPASPLLIATGEVGDATEGLIITVAGVITGPAVRRGC